MRFSYLDHLECGRCATRHDAGTVQGTCTQCGAPLLARYDLTALAADLTPETLASRPPDLWRYHELLPVTAPEHVITLGEGMTPLLSLPSLGEQIGLPRLLMKDEGSLPTVRSRRAAPPPASPAPRSWDRGDRDANQRQCGRGLGGLRGTRRTRGLHRDA